MTRPPRRSPGDRATRRAHDEGGAAAVEFALIGTVFLMLLFAIITFGLVFALNHTLSHAAAEGARSGLVAGSATAVTVAETAAENRLGWLGTGATVVATLEPCDGDPARECIRVVTTYDYLNNPLVPPLPGFGLIMPDVMSRSAVVQITQVG